MSIFRLCGRLKLAGLLLTVPLFAIPIAQAIEKKTPCIRALAYPVGETVSKIKAVGSGIDAATIEALAEEIVGALSVPPETNEDLNAMMDVISALSPELHTLISAAREKVKIEMGDKSACYRAGFADRSTAFAPKVSIAKNSTTAMFEVVHEIRHAVPLPADFTRNLTLDPKSESDEEMKRKILAFFDMEEALSVEAEIQLNQALAGFGIYFDYEAMRPGVMERYESGGVAAVARDLPTLVPGWRVHYGKMADQLIAMAKNPLMAPRSWSYAGIAIQSGAGQGSITIDPSKFSLTKFRRDAAKIAEDPELSTQIGAALKQVGSWLESLKTYLPSSAESPPQFATDPVSSVDGVEFSKLSPQSYPLVMPAEVSAAEKMDLRVALAGRFPKFLSSSVEGTEPDRQTGDHFTQLLLLASRYSDAAAAKTYKTLLDFSMSEIQEGSRDGVDHLIELGLALIKSGNREQGEEVLKYLIDQRLNMLSLEKVTGFLKSLIELEEWSLVERIFPHLDAGFSSQSVGHSIFRHYEREGKFTDVGRQKVEEYLKHHSADEVTSEAMFALIKPLQGTKDYVPENERVLRSPMTYLEKSIAENMVNFAPRAREYSDIATSLKNHPRLATAYLSLATKIYQTAIREAWRLKRLGVAETEEKFNVKYDPSKPVRALQEALLRNPDYNSEYDITEGLYSSVVTVIRELSRDRNFSTLAVEQLSKMEGTILYISLYTNLAGNLASDFDPIALRTFLADWMKKLNDLGPVLASRKYIEDERSEYVANQIEQIPAGVATPKSILETHLAHKHLLKMIELLLKRTEPELVNYGATLLDHMSERRDFYNQYEHVSPTAFFFGNPGGYAVHRIKYFDATVFKVGALARSAELSPARRTEWLDQAYRMYKQIKFNPKSEGFWDYDEALGVAFDLTQRLVEAGDLTRSTEILKAMQSSLREARVHIDSEIKRVSKPGSDPWDHYDLRDSLKIAEFWEQHLASYIKARFATGYLSQGDRSRADSLLNELMSSFENEITNRRSRFNEKSMMLAAKEFSQAKEFSDSAKRAFELSIEKTGLVRDKGIMNDSNIKFFETSITESGLEDSVKDHLLTLLVKRMTQTESSDKQADSQAFAALARLTNDIIEAKKYPMAELECLRVLNEKTKGMHYDRDDYFENKGKLQALQSVFKRVTADHPELVDSKNFSAISAHVRSSEARVGLVALMPEASKEAAKLQTGNSDQLPDLDQIKSGLIDTESILPRMARDLRAAVGQRDLAKMDRVLAIYKEIIYQTLAKRRLKQDKSILLRELVQLNGVSDLYQLVKNRLGTPVKPSVEERKILATLLAARNSDEASAKRSLFIEILKSTSAPLEAKRLAIEGMVKCKYEGSFLASYFENKIVVANDKEQLHFFEVIRVLLNLDEEFPSDNVFPFLVQNNSAGAKFLVRYVSVRGKQVLRKVDAYEYKDGFSKRDYFAERDRLLTAQGFWHPSLMSEPDLVIVYQLSFSWFMSYDQFIQDVRAMYVDRNIDISGPRDYIYTYTADNIESYIRRLIPGFTFTADERHEIHNYFRLNKMSYRLIFHQQVVALPPERGQLSLRDLQLICPRLVLSGTQKDTLMKVLAANDDSRLKILSAVFGDYDHYASKGLELSHLLDKAEGNFRKHQDDLAQQKIETPSWFAELPELVRFMMTRFFVQLPFGEREALLSEYKAQGKPQTNEVGVRRFFELTHMDKVGQYLSTRRDLLPESYRAELERFQEDGASSSYDEVRATIEGEFNRPLNHVFSQFNQTAVKAGTIGEVYKAITTDGEEVAVKVITPSKRKALKTMLERLEKVADDLERIRDRVQGAFNPNKVFREFADSIRAELDFRNELANSEVFRKHLPDGVVIPPYRRDLVGQSVLVQRWAKGVHIRQIVGTRFAKSTIDRLGTMLIKQITEIGLIHDDIHPGNVRVNPVDGTIELFDFGRRGTLTDKERQHLPQLLMAIRSKSVAQVVSHLVAVSESITDYDQQGLTRALAAVLADSSLSAQVRVDRIFNEAQKAGVEVNSGYLVVVKAMTTFEGFARVLNPQFSFEEFIRTYFFNRTVGHFFNFGGRK